MNDSAGVDSHFLRWFATTPEDTEAFGACLAAARPSVDGLAIVYLSGDLGAGKTTFARGFLRAAGISSPVRSPTYTLVEAYHAPALTVVHLDLYRLNEPSELEALALREWARPGHVWLVEWPDRAGDRLPVPDLSVALTGGQNAHEINVKARSALGQSWLSAVENRSAAP